MFGGAWGGEGELGGVFRDGAGGEFFDDFCEWAVGFSFGEEGFE